MRWLKTFYLGLGVALFAVIVANTDLGGVWAQISRVGWAGFALVVAIYLAAFLSDTFSWQLTFKSVPLDLKWLERLFFVRLVGEAFNNVIPAGSVGGEPVKAAVLKQRYGIGLKESGATLVLAKTINLLGLLAFLMLGFGLLILSEKIPDSLKLVAGVGLVALSAGTAGFFLVQRLQITSWLSQRASRRPLFARLARFVQHIEEVDGHFEHFYVSRRARFAAAVALAAFNWLLGVVELYVAMILLGFPVSVTDAMIIEAMAQLVRAGTFFIPASIGAQEGIFVLVIKLLTGDAALGLAAALLRRCRELVWIAAGLAFAWFYSVRGDGVGPR